MRWIAVSLTMPVNTIFAIIIRTQNKQTNKDCEFIKTLKLLYKYLASVVDDKWGESRFHGRCQSTQSFSCVLFIKKPKGVEKKFLNKQYLQLGSTKEIGGEWCEKNSKVTYEYWSTSYRTLNNSQGEQFSIKE